MDLIEIIKAFLLGIIQGITEWLPISSTGHMIIFNAFWPLDASRYADGKAFIDLFMTVIQFGSILAVILLYFNRLNPFTSKKTKLQKRETLSIWAKVLVAAIPAGIVGLLFRNKIHDFLYNAVVVALMLILYGVLFIVIENKKIKPSITGIDQLNFKTVFVIGIFQMLALVPGTSRSGATIVGALILGCSRYVGAEFSFFLAIPTMFGASLVEILSYFRKNGLGFTLNEWTVLLTGMIVAFAVSVFAISFLMKFIRTHDFKPFAWYRIVVGVLLLLLFVSGVVGTPEY